MSVQQHVGWVLLHLTTELKIPALLGKLSTVSQAVVLSAL